MAILAQIQNAASEVVTERPAKKPDEVFGHIRAYDWSAEYAKRDALGEDYAAPQLSLISETSGDILHIIPEDAGTYEIWLHTDAPRKILGVIPMKTSVLLTSSKCPEPKMQSAVTHFMAGNTAWFTTNFQKD